MTFVVEIWTPLGLLALLLRAAKYETIWCVAVEITENFTAAATDFTANCDNFVGYAFVISVFTA